MLSHTISSAHKLQIPNKGEFLHRGEFYGLSGEQGNCDHIIVDCLTKLCFCYDGADACCNSCNSVMRVIVINLENVVDIC